jgi:hypothetical protein
VAQAGDVAAHVVPPPSREAHKAMTDNDKVLDAIERNTQAIKAMHDSIATIIWMLIAASVPLVVSYWHW